MRLTYLDEAGTSRSEPYTVVAGVLVHGDIQLARVEDHLSSLVIKHAPEHDPVRFVFHATNIWSGTGPIFRDRDRWPLEKRIAILNDLADIPSRFGLPITCGIVERANIKETVQRVDERALDFVCYASAFATALQVVENHLRCHYPNEYTLIIAEDRDKVRKNIKLLHLMLQARGEEKIPPSIVERFGELPFHHIRDAVHFAGKTESRLLQVADTCAFLLRGHVAGSTKAAAIFERLGNVFLGHEPLPERA